MFGSLPWISLRLLRISWSQRFYTPYSVHSTGVSQGDFFGGKVAAKGLAVEVLPNAALALDEPQLLDPGTIFAILKSSARRMPILVIFRTNLEGDKLSKRHIGIQNEHRLVDWMQYHLHTKARNLSCFAKEGR